jgi:hypothetical protein
MNGQGLKKKKKKKKYLKIGLISSNKLGLQVFAVAVFNEISNSNLFLCIVFVIVIDDTMDVLIVGIKLLWFEHTPRRQPTVSPFANIEFQSKYYIVK